MSVLETTNGLNDWYVLDHCPAGISSLALDQDDGRMEQHCRPKSFDNGRFVIISAHSNVVVQLSLPTLPLVPESCSNQ